MSPSLNHRASKARRLAFELASYVPLFAAFGLFAHLAWFGLRPTLAEGARLAEVHERFAGVHATLQRDLLDLRGELSALADPMTQERLRRRMRNAGLKPPGEPR